MFNFVSFSNFLSHNFNFYSCNIMQLYRNMMGDELFSLILFLLTFSAFFNELCAYVLAQNISTSYPFEILTFHHFEIFLVSGFYSNSFH